MMVGCNWVFHIKYKVDGNIEKGANKIKRANNVILEKDYMSLCPKKTFLYKWIFEQFSFANCYNKWL